MALLGGCVGGDTAGSGTSSETTEPAGTKTSETSVESPTTQTETVTELPAGTSTSAQKTEATCGGARYPVTPTESTVRFEDLSEKGKRLFLRARNNEQSLYVYDTSRKPPEFKYTDERRSYVIIQEGSKYRMFTYTNAGCSFPAKTDSRENR